ncbi:NAD(P)-dependent oxidoreductase [Nonomuraea lactucae]|uniref:NAD(P)-dependent oxidoreductase n=1 Tax=Nonomuraea lactucae TaxID=2249762 RepID=UPI00196604B1|nr:NAD(P)-dependent oxidoreductase [Nonomuraea lactucae]
MKDNDLPTVGFIGLGDQGLPMAIAIADAGYPMHAWGRRPDSLAALSDVCHVGHEDLTDFAAACDIVGLCVSTDDDVSGLVTGGLADHLRPGSVIVNHGTGTPKTAKDLAAFCADRRVEFLDAPVSGARAGAEARTLTTLVGGPAAVVKHCESVFRSFSAHVLHLGPHGAGQLAKLINNTLLMMNRANVADVIELLTAGGIDPIPFVEAAKLGSGSSRALQLLPTRSPADFGATVAHLTEVELLDMDIFATAMTDLGIDAAPTTARAVSGARRLGDVLHALNPRPCTTPDDVVTAALAGIGLTGTVIARGVED